MIHGRSGRNLWGRGLFGATVMQLCKLTHATQGELGSRMYNARAGGLSRKGWGKLRSRSLRREICDERGLRFNFRACSSVIEGLKSFS